MGLVCEQTHIFQDVFQRTRNFEDARVRSNPDYRTQHLPRYSICCAPVDDAFQPGLVFGMAAGITAKGVQQYVHVREYQLLPSIRSRSALLSSRSTPGSV